MRPTSLSTIASSDRSVHHLSAAEHEGRTCAICGYWEEDGDYASHEAELCVSFGGHEWFDPQLDDSHGPRR